MTKLVNPANKPRIISVTNLDGFIRELTSRSRRLDPTKNFSEKFTLCSFYTLWSAKTFRADSQIDQNKRCVTLSSKLYIQDRLLVLSLRQKTCGQEMASLSPGIGHYLGRCRCKHLLWIMHCAYRIANWHNKFKTKNRQNLPEAHDSNAQL